MQDRRWLYPYLHAITNIELAQVCESDCSSVDQIQGLLHTSATNIDKYLTSKIVEI